MTLSRKESYYPSFFKIAREVPVFKGEDSRVFSNYRPVSVLPVLSQVFERVLKERLVAFLEREGVVTPGQYGFREGHSTTMAILDMVESRDLETIGTLPDIVLANVFVIYVIKMNSER